MDFTLGSCSLTQTQTNPWWMINLLKRFHVTGTKMYPAVNQNCKFYLKIVNCDHVIVNRFWCHTLMYKDVHVEFVLGQLQAFKLSVSSEFTAYYMIKVTRSYIIWRFDVYVYDVYNTTW